MNLITKSVQHPSEIHIDKTKQDLQRNWRIGHHILMQIDLQIESNSCSIIREKNLVLNELCRLLDNLIANLSG